jgi:curved DNA-binding protein CbpA
MSADTLYEVLGVARTADHATIKAAYRALAKATHPDLNPGDPDAAARFAQVTDAWAILGDPDLRGHYDLDLIEAAQARRPRKKRAPPKYYGSKPPETWPRDPNAHIDEIRRQARAGFGDTTARWEAERKAKAAAQAAELDAIRASLARTAAQTAARARTQQQAEIDRAVAWANAQKAGRAPKSAPPSAPEPAPAPAPAPEGLPWENLPEPDGPLPWEQSE